MTAFTDSERENTERTGNEYIKGETSRSGLVVIASTQRLGDRGSIPPLGQT